MFMYRMASNKRLPRPSALASCVYLRGVGAFVRLFAWRREAGTPVLHGGRAVVLRAVLTRCPGVTAAAHIVFFFSFTQTSTLAGLGLAVHTANKPRGPLCKRAGHVLIAR